MRPKPGDETVAGGALLLHSKIHATVADKFVQLFERPFIEEQIYSFARGKLAGFVFALASFGTAAGLGFRGLAAEFFHAVVVLLFCTRGGVFLRQAFLREQRAHF